MSVPWADSVFCKSEYKQRQTRKSSSARSADIDTGDEYLLVTYRHRFGFEPNIMQRYDSRWRNGRVCYEEGHLGQIVNVLSIDIPWP